MRKHIAMLTPLVLVATEGDDNLQVWAGLNSALQGLGGNDTNWMRRRIHAALFNSCEAANDEAANAWRVAA